MLLKMSMREKYRIESCPGSRSQCIHTQEVSVPDASRNPVTWQGSCVEALPIPEFHCVADPIHAQCFLEVSSLQFVAHLRVSPGAGQLSDNTDYRVNSFLKTKPHTFINIFPGNLPCIQYQNHLLRACCSLRNFQLPLAEQSNRKSYIVPSLSSLMLLRHKKTYVRKQRAHKLLKKKLWY